MASRIPILDLSRQYKILKPQLEKAVGRVMAKGVFILGPEVRLFEEEFSRFCSTRFGVGVASGTDALELALRAAGVGPGDLVATVSFTFCATVDAIHHVGAHPLFVDIQPDTFTMDPADLQKRIKQLGSKERRRLKAVIPVHLYGHPCDMDAMKTVAKRFSLIVIEDAAQAAGARWKGQPVGSCGDLGCFSFFPSKTLGGFGDGGMVVTNSEEMAGRLRLLRVHGRKDRENQILSGGRNSRLDELQAAILRVKLKAFPRWIEKRQKLATAYATELSDARGIRCPVTVAGARHAYCLYVIRSKNRDALQQVLNQRGITAHIYYSIPVHRQPVYGRKYKVLSLPETDRASKEVLALPFFPELRPTEIARVCRAVTAAVAS